MEGMSDIQTLQDLRDGLAYSLDPVKSLGNDHKRLRSRIQEHMERNESWEKGNGALFQDHGEAEGTGFCKFCGQSLDHSVDE